MGGVYLGGIYSGGCTDMGRGAHFFERGAHLGGFGGWLIWEEVLTWKGEAH